MYGEVDKIKLGKICQIGVIFCPKTINNITVKKSPWYCGRDHSSAFAY